MKLRAKYLLAFLSSTVITLFVVGVSMYGFYKLNKTTNYLVTINNKVLEYANLYEKDLAQSRRAEKEFFIFPNNPEKQRKYINSWDISMDKINEYTIELEKLFILEHHEPLLKKIREARLIIAENRLEWATVVTKFQETKSYDIVNKAEYGKYKERIHVLENIGRKLSVYGLSEVEKGKLEINKIQKQSNILIKLVAVFAVLWGIIVPITIAKKMTTAIVSLCEIADSISKGDIVHKIDLKIKDEIGDLFRSINLMQNSVHIMIKNYKNSRNTS